jgi:hypothetical protein
VGGLGALGIGCGTSELEHILITQTIALKRPKSMRITLAGTLGPHVSAKDLSLRILALFGSSFGRGYAIEFAGALRLQDVPLLEVGGASITGGASVAIVTKSNGAPSQNCRFRVAFKNVYNGQSCQLHIKTPYNGTTADIWFDVSQYWSIPRGVAQVIAAATGTLVGDWNVWTVRELDAADGYTWAYYFEPQGRFAGHDFDFQNEAASEFFGYPTFTSGLIGTASKVQDGSLVPVNEVQEIRHTGRPTGGTWTLTFYPIAAAGQTTAALNYDAAASDVQTALENLAALVPGDVAVTRTGTVATGFVWTVTFAGAYAGVNLSPMTGAAGSLTGAQPQVFESQVWAFGLNERQLVTLGASPAGGTFTLTYAGSTTTGVAWNATAGTLQAALEALASIGSGNVSVTLIATSQWRVEFIGTLGSKNVNPMTGSGASLSGAAVYVNTIQAAFGGTNEQQRVEILAATGGTFTLTFGANTTSAIPRYASAQVVQFALESLASIGSGNALVMGDNGGPWVVYFQGSLKASDVALMTASAASLTGAGTQTATVTAVTTPTGPNWGDEPENYDSGAVPTTGDSLIIEGSASLLWGLDNLSAVTLAQLDVPASFAGSIGLPIFNAAGFAEYRPTSWKIGVTKAVIGEGTGTGSSRLRFNFQAVQTEVLVYQTAAPADGTQSLIFKGTNAANVARVYRGSVGVATEHWNDAAALATLQIGWTDSQETDANVAIGNGVTQLTAVNQFGGFVYCHAGFTVWNLRSGSVLFMGSGTAGTLNAYEGTFNYNSSGTLTTLVVASGGVVLFSQDLRSRTVTNATVAAGSTLKDPAKTVTWTNGILLQNCNLSEVDLDVGTGITLGVS